MQCIFGFLIFPPTSVPDFYVMATTQAQAIEGRGTTWLEEHEVALVSIYFEEEIQNIVYRKCSQKLAEIDIIRTPKIMPVQNQAMVLKTRPKGWKTREKRRR